MLQKTSLILAQAIAHSCCRLHPLLQFLLLSLPGSFPSLCLQPLWFLLLSWTNSFLPLLLQPLCPQP
ncbi:hypothetical protein K439DRAFT_1635700 [Ramaria rubella]|nr:hypothetical protein K439DRAFT_1635700 [Ramaria rubella]